MTEPDYGPLIEFMKSRAPWFTVAVVPALNGSRGCDIVLRLDGTYTDDPHSRDVLGPVTPGFMAHELAEALAAAQITTLNDWHNNVEVEPPCAATAARQHRRRPSSARPAPGASARLPSTT
jgi:hypothetical protein